MENFNSAERFCFEWRLVHLVTFSLCLEPRTPRHKNYRKARVHLRTVNSSMERSCAEI